MMLHTDVLALSVKTQQVLDDVYQSERVEAKDRAEIRYEDYGIDYRSRAEELNTKDDSNDALQVIGLDIILKIADKDFVKLNILEQQAYESLLAGEYENAIVLYIETLEARPNDLNVMVAIASAYHKLGDYAEAEAYYADVLQVDSGHEVALYNYLALVGKNDPDEAMLELMRLTEIRNNDAYLHSQIGYLFAQSQNYEKAIAYYRTSSTIEPENYNYRYNLAVALDKSGDFGVAKEVYWGILKSIPLDERASIPFVKVRERYAFLKGIT